MSTTAIIGLGVTGYSCVRYLHGRERLVVVDTRAEPPFAAQARQRFSDVEFRLGVSAFDFAGVQRVVVSPGVALDSCLLHPARQQGIEIVSDLDLFCRAVTAPVIAVTGTNGKSTVTSLVGHILNHAGRHAVTGGNLGRAALDLLADEAELYVLELSSFQLERMASYPFAAAAILNLSDDHLDRHGDMPSYTAAKHRIYAGCTLAVANRADPLTLPQVPVGRLVTFGLEPAAAGHWGILELAGEADGDRDGSQRRQRWLAHGQTPVMDSAQLPLAGRHNEANVLAAFALLEDSGLSHSQLVAGAASFVGLPHRCQRVAERAGVVYVNDSKATNVGAALAALAGLGNADRPNLVLIAGGVGKGADFTPLRDAVGRYVKAVVLIGIDANQIEAALGDVVPVCRADSMAQAVASAAELAQPGDVVLLSPACASLDMFANFAERGDIFSRQVEALDA